MHSSLQNRRGFFNPLLKLWPFSKYFQDSTFFHDAQAVFKFSLPEQPIQADIKIDHQILNKPVFVFASQRKKIFCTIIYYCLHMLKLLIRFVESLSVHQFRHMSSETQKSKKQWFVRSQPHFGSGNCKLETFSVSCHASKWWRTLDIGEYSADNLSHVRPYHLFMTFIFMTNLLRQNL